MPRTADELDSEDVAFDPNDVAAEWLAFNDEDNAGIPATAAAAIVAEWFDESVTAEDGVESDRDVIFPDAEIMVEEKAMGVCDRRTAEAYAAGFFELNREDGRVLALNGAAIYEDWSVSPAFCDEHQNPAEEANTEEAPQVET